AVPNTSELVSLGGWAAVRPLTCVAESADNCVWSRTAMPLVLIAPTWDALIDWMSVAVSASIAVVDNRLICRLDREEIVIAPAVSDFFKNQERPGPRDA